MKHANLIICRPLLTIAVVNFTCMNAHSLSSYSFSLRFLTLLSDLYISATTKICYYRQDDNIQKYTRQ